MGYPATGPVAGRQDHSTTVNLRSGYSNADAGRIPAFSCACPSKGAAGTARRGQNCILNHIGAINSKGADESLLSNDVDHHMSSDWLLKRARWGYVAGDMHGDVAFGCVPTNDQHSWSPTIRIAHAHVGAEAGLPDQ